MARSANDSVDGPVAPRLIARLRAIHRREGLAGVAREAIEAVRWRLSPTRHRYVRELKEQQRRDEEYDRLHDVSTCGDAPLTSLGVSFEEAKRGNSIYRPIWSELFHEAMAELDIDHRRYVFVDYGSGKGKALLLASDYPFQRIIGVEYAQPLHRAAVENIRRYRSPRQRCHEIESVCVDALAFEPPDSPLVCLLFNPFDEETTARMLVKLRESVERSPRPCLLLYVNIRDTGEKRHVFQRVTGLESLKESRRVLIYELRPARVGESHPR